MKLVHCDGCNFTEAEDVPRSKRQILPVTIRVENDPRWPEGTAKHMADLCSSCMSLLLHTYFKIPMTDRLELDVPTFNMPEELEHARSPV